MIHVAWSIQLMTMMTMTSGTILFVPLGFSSSFVAAVATARVLFLIIKPRQTSLLLYLSSFDGFILATFSL